MAGRADVKMTTLNNIELSIIELLIFEENLLPSETLGYLVSIIILNYREAVS